MENGSKRAMRVGQIRLMPIGENVYGHLVAMTVVPVPGNPKRIRHLKVAEIEVSVSHRGELMETLRREVQSYMDMLKDSGTNLRVVWEWREIPFHLNVVPE